MVTTTAPDPAATAPPVTSPGRPRRRGALRRWGCRLGVVVLAVLMVWQGPALVAYSPLRHRIVPWLVPEYRGRIVVGSATLGWFGPVVLRDVEAFGPDGDRLLRIASLRSEKSLLALLTDRPRAGHFYITEPELSVRLRGDGSNLEDATAGLWTAAGGSPLEFTLEIRDGRVQVIDPAAAQQVRFDAVTATIHQPLEPAEPLHLTAAGTIDNVDPTSGRGRLSLDLSIPGTAATSAAQGKLTLENLRLSPLAPLLERFTPDAQLTGAVSCQLELGWGAASVGMPVPGSAAVSAASGAGETPTLRPKGTTTAASSPTATVAGTFAVRELILHAPQWLGADTLRAERAELAGQIEVAGDELRSDGLTLQSDLGECQLSGAVAVGELRNLTTTDGWRMLAERDVRCRGKIDLARVATTLPGTLRIRNDVRLTAGAAEWNVVSEPTDDGRRWQATLETRGIAAAGGPQPIAWEQPLSVSLAARRSPEGIAVERFACRSDFLQLVGQAGADVLLVSGEGDLDRLTGELGQVLDLGGWHVAGQCTADLRVHRQPDNRLSATGTLKIDRFRLSVPGQPEWSEPQLAVEFDLNGTTVGPALRQIDAGTLQLTAGTDRGSIRLLQPLPLADSAAPLACHAECHGALESWATRLRPWLPLDDWTLHGTADVAANLTLTTDAIQFADARLEGTSLDVRGPALHLREPWARIETAGIWNRAESRLSAARTTWMSPSLSLRADDLSFACPDGAPPALAGTVIFRGGLGEVLGWVLPPTQSGDLSWSGVLAGQARLTHTAAASEFDGRLSITDLVVRQRTATGDFAALQASFIERPVWTEPNLSLTGRATYRAADGRLDIAALQVASQALALTMQGAVSDASGPCVADLRGEIDADPAKLLALLHPAAGGELRVTGHAPRPFLLKGPLRPAGSPALVAQAGISWQTLDAYGLTAGAGQWDGELRDGVVQFSRLDLPVSDGRLTLQPRIILGRTSPRLVHDAGSVIEGVRLSPALCRHWLKFVAPLVADATEIDGRLSVRIEGIDLPLGSPAAGTVRGQLDVQETQVRPGPLILPVLQLGRQIQSLVQRRPLPPLGDKVLVRIPAQQIVVQLASGRLRHETVEFVAGDLVIRTHGSVGLDDTLDLTAEIPLRDEWLSHDRKLAGLQGTTLRIPIGGTVHQPRIDARAVATLARQLAVQTGGHLIEDELRKQLERLLPGR